MCPFGLGQLVLEVGQIVLIVVFYGGSVFLEEEDVCVDCCVCHPLE